VNSDQQADNEAETLEQRVSEEPEWQQEHLIYWGLQRPFPCWRSCWPPWVCLASPPTPLLRERMSSEPAWRAAIQVLRIIFFSILIKVGGGVVASLVLTLVPSRFLANWQTGNAQDPIILLIATAVLIVVTILTCTVPARRAAKVEPMIALRYE
jgi:hypothetical protein